MGWTCLRGCVAVLRRWALAEGELWGCGMKRSLFPWGQRKTVTNKYGRAIVRRLLAGLPPRRPGFQVRSGHMGFVVDKVALGAGFLQVLRFPLPILIPPTAPHSSSSIIRDWYNRPISGRRTKWTNKSHPTSINKKNALKTNWYFVSKFCM
jgi:hypothetical protein